MSATDDFAPLDEASVVAYPADDQPTIADVDAKSGSRRAVGRRRRLLTTVAAVASLTLALFAVSSLFLAGNQANALSGHPEILRKGCTWDKSGNYVQNCKVWSESQQREVIVQIRASNGSDQGVYLLDGMRAAEDRSAWTTDVQAAKVYDGSTDTTLVMPVGGASSFYTDWDGGAGAGNKTIKQETFLTSELPAYLSENFGVSPHNNAIVGLSMSGGPAVTLAERHPDQFKVVQAMSGYYQTDNPIGNAGVLATQTMVSNYTNGIINMWGAPGSARWTENDPSKNVNKLKENGQTLIISSGNGFLTKSEMAKLSQQDQISAMLLEMLSAVSTVLFQLQAAQSGANVISLPNYGGHTWENWGRALNDGKSHVLKALRETPPITEKTQVVSAEGSPDPDGQSHATIAAKKAAAIAPSLTPEVLATVAAEDDGSTEAAAPTFPNPVEPTTVDESTVPSAPGGDTTETTPPVPTDPHASDATEVPTPEESNTETPTTTTPEATTPEATSTNPPSTVVPLAPTGAVTPTSTPPTTPVR
ncbi:alpha/beta hydrolase family protein [Gordonia sp. ABSL1-1]|uniref:alpha/beta hydrolase n=1 Tax=Gordonia sp. ABSL1-1 TaxID=3053923 RepID=UPI0025728FDC|nr:alpha/beta hydrolase family protein [Gordonia sp. ABSL1-1]MDL9938453.1 alpha/beta hydrolase family protein [Gordonia sp. ABSL1-1]